MDTIVGQTANRRRRQGQTLAEFAITLPTLLILLFGIIEFGRIFQAWVSLQNAARTGARYASTGQYFEEQFVMNTILNEAQPGNPDGFIPCVDDGPEPFRKDGNIDRRGTKTTVVANSGGTPVNVYTGDLESLFATWYDGRNCDPRNIDDQDRRKDMARIISIMLEARRGAAGLALEPDQWSVPTDPATKKDIAGKWNLFPWFAGWQTTPRPPRSDQRGWFNVVVCSNRSFNDDTSAAMYKIDVSDAANRFIPYQGDVNLLVGTDPVTPWAPSCLLNEVPSALIKGQPNPLLANGGFSNAGQAWMDPGAPEDTVFVTVTFNHPLITPLGIAPFIPLQARRSAIVETFRTAGNRKGTVFVPPIGANAPPELNTATFTPSPTFTNTPLPSNTPSPSPTPSKTPVGPFNCALISISNKILVGPQLQMDIQNDNAQSTYLTRVQITWPNIPAFAQMGLIQMSLNTVQNWVGNDLQNLAATSTTTDTDSKPGNPPFSNTSTAIRDVPAGDISLYAATFNGPPMLASYVSASQYAITITLNNPLNAAAPCILNSNAIVVTATPTVPGQPTATRTPTPDCASSLIGIQFNSFDNFGLVRYDIISRRNVTSTLVSVLINWKKYVNSQRLVQVSMMAPPGEPGSVVVWQSGNVNQDSTPPTNSKTEGIWRTNYTLAAGSPTAPSITPIYFDFDGIYRYDEPELVNSTNPRYGGTSDFNFSEFELTCGTPGGSSGSTTGGQPTGKITPENYPTPTNVPTQGPTNTPAPTLTPSKTYTPSKTPTKGPSTATFTPKPPTLPPPPTTVPTLPPPPTDIDGSA